MNMTVVHEDNELKSSRKEDLAGPKERSLSRSRSAHGKNFVGQPVIQSSNFEALEANQDSHRSDKCEPPLIINSGE